MTANFIKASDSKMEVTSNLVKASTDTKMEVPANLVKALTVKWRC